jgi:hypothetical protein
MAIAACHTDTTSAPVPASRSWFPHRPAAPGRRGSIREETNLGPVRQAIQARMRAPRTLYTLGQNKPFELSAIDDDGIVLMLGRGRWHTRLTWDCLESIVPFMRAQPGWVPAGGKFSVAGEPGTLDQHLKRYLKRDVARWVVLVLRDAGVAETSERPALHVRLSGRYRQ